MPLTLRPPLWTLRPSGLSTVSPYASRIPWCLACRPARIAGLRLAARPHRPHQLAIPYLTVAAVADVDLVPCSSSGVHARDLHPSVLLLPCGPAHPPLLVSFPRPLGPLRPRACPVPPASPSSVPDTSFRCQHPELTQLASLAAVPPNTLLYLPPSPSCTLRGPGSALGTRVLPLSPLLCGSRPRFHCCFQAVLFKLLGTYAVISAADEPGRPPVPGATLCLPLDAPVRGGQSTFPWMIQSRGQSLCLFVPSSAPARCFGPFWKRSFFCTRSTLLNHFGTALLGLLLQPATAHFAWVRRSRRELCRGLETTKTGCLRVDFMRLKMAS